MKKAIHVFALTLIFNYFQAQNVEITFHNRTGYDIDSIRIPDNIYISLKANKSVVLSDYKELYFGISFPFGMNNGVIHYKTKSTINLFVCGTDSRQRITEGKFEYNIDLFEDESGYRLIYH